MKSFLGGIALILLVACLSHAQQTASLFQDDTPLEISFTAPLSELKHEDEDSVYFASVLTYKAADGSFDSVHVGLRARGNYRRKHCALPPLRIKIKKQDRKKDGLFAGVKSLKLVLPCQNTRSSNDLILKEYLCYQLYEPTTPYVLNTRLVNITLTETTGKHQVLKLTGFLIEDDDDAARRLDAKVVSSETVNPFMLQDTCAIRFDVFQYMIGNTDYSTVYLHNAKVLRTKSNVLLPIAYDFDMSGFVSAPYASVDPALGIETVRQRMYRGFCRGDVVAECVRREYLNLEATLLGVIDKHESLFSEKESTGMKRYLKEFFETMRNDGVYRQRVGRACRTN